MQELEGTCSLQAWTAALCRSSTRGVRPEARTLGVDGMADGVARRPTTSWHEDDSMDDDLAEDLNSTRHVTPAGML